MLIVSCEGNPPRKRRVGRMTLRIGLCSCQQNGVRMLVLITVSILLPIYIAVSLDIDIRTDLRHVNLNSHLEDTKKQPLLVNAGRQPGPDTPSHELENPRYGGL
jgi:hypothetical protein